MRLSNPLLLAALLSTALTSPVLAQNARNVIVMISDGAGMETWNAASYYRHGALGHEVYDTFPVRVFASTHPLTTSKTPTHSTEGAVRFDPAALWTANRVETLYEGKIGTYPGYFDGYDYARADFTDSAAAGTALATGHKTYNSAINWSNDDTRLKHIGEFAVESGRALGSISSVQWSHATPAAFLAHNPDRNAYEEIGTEIVTSGLATVVMGSGHPYFDADGQPVVEPEEKAFKYVGGRDTWAKLAAGETEYRLIETRADFEALAAGTLDLGGKEKVIGTAQNNATLQFNRSGVAMGDLLENQPDLPTMTLGAIELLSQDPDGFFLMVEGGAVDWAAHANNLPRLIEEQIDFNESVEAVVDWVEANSSWDETLLIITTDHGNGLIAGPNSDQMAYQPIINQGAGALPLVRWHNDNHTRELVPVYAQGAGAEFFLKAAKPAPGLAAYGVPAEQQVYVDNTDVFRAALTAFGLAASN